MATLRRWILGLAVALAASAALAQTDDFEAHDETVRYWVEKIEMEQARASKAQRDIARLESEIAKAKRRQKPRGEVLTLKIDELEKARETSAEAEALLPQLFEGARRAGVEPGALRHLE